MNRNVIGFLASFMMLLCTFSVCAQNGALSEYRLGSGDKIRIHVFGEDTLTVETLLSDAGTISYPFLGEIKVKGLTAGQLEKLITDGLKGPYLVDPKVNVSVLEYRPFYIHGEVQKSGGYPYQPGLTLRKAISLASGFTERAAEDKIYVIHEGDTAQAHQPMKMDDPVSPGDTITVEQSFF